MENITFFNRLTLALFEKLYSSFPTPVDIDVKAVAMTIIPEDAEPDETWDCLQAAEDAIDFLTQEGFLTHKGTYLEGGTFLQARLTLKGLAILGSTPDALEGRQPLIDRIRKVLSGGAKEAGAEAVKLLTQQAFAAAVAAAPAVIAGITR
jgi:hypothetical protein